MKAGTVRSTDYMVRFLELPMTPPTVFKRCVQLDTTVPVALNTLAQEITKINLVKTHVITVPLVSNAPLQCFPSVASLITVNQVI
jgi:hypothetical protein